jgi:parvulin-like peptidyl-prolyl isomerase
VIKVEERKKADIPSFEEMKSAIRNELSQDAGSAYIKKLRKEAKITRFNTDSKPRKDTPSTGGSEGGKKP